MESVFKLTKFIWVTLRQNIIDGRLMVDTSKKTYITPELVVADLKDHIPPEKIGIRTSIDRLLSTINRELENPNPKYNGPQMGWEVRDGIESYGIYMLDYDKDPEEGAENL